MEICSLASGSNGNAIYVGSRSSGVSILLDCGISRRQLSRRLQHVGKQLDRIKAIFITHEHADHIRGLEITSKYHAIPIYLTQGTYYGVRRKAMIGECCIIQRNDTIQLEDLMINTIPKSHDAGEPVALVITKKKKKILYATDFGQPNENIIQHIAEANVIFLETNYDEEMLQNGPYPLHLKRRICSSYGHMSNVDSAKLIREYASPHLSHLILGHLSENNNHPVLVQREIESILGERTDLKPLVMIASRYTVGELVQIET